MSRYDDRVEIAVLVKENKRLQAEIDRLQAIVDKLPTTADGVVVTPRMTLYQNTEHCGMLRRLVLCSNIQDYKSWYSTREAAEAVGEKQ